MVLGQFFCAILPETEAFAALPSGPARSPAGLGRPGDFSGPTEMTNLSPG
jgi:hypothetical protein